jgi:arylformamidase
MIIHDITLPLCPDIAVWPGDVSFSLNRTLTISDGNPVNLGSISLSLHAGTHMDAPYHVDENGATADAFDLTVCMGAARVIDVAGKCEITCQDLYIIETERVPRILLKTGAWRDCTIFPDEVPTLAADVPSFLFRCGVKLLGVDVPSVDKVSSKDLPIHKELTRFGITILESLYLAETPEGIYDLTALPLKIVGADGAPVRAILKGAADL